MDEHERTEDERVEDLDTPESEADEVKGGAADIFAKIGDIKSESVAFKYDRNIRPTGWSGGNHNESLIVI